jgi:hypothetical protein
LLTKAIECSGTNNDDDEEDDDYDDGDDDDDDDIGCNDEDGNDVNDEFLRIYSRLLIMTSFCCILNNCSCFSVD